jgi:hypothetical protein
MTNETDFRKRVQFVLAAKNLNPRSLSDGDDNLWKKLYNQITKEKTITYSLIEALLNHAPDLRTEWLFRGEGEPFRTGESIEDQLAAIQERLSALEGERKNDNNQEAVATIA